MTDALEKVIRPIVEGQLRGFVKEHPEVLDGVTWYKGDRHDKVTAFVNSIAKRINRDLLCPTSRARMAAALLQSHRDKPSLSAVALVTAAGQPALGVISERGLRRFRFLRWLVRSPASLQSKEGV
jgi:hypothetical protein